MSVYLKRLTSKKPPPIIQEKSLYKLSGPTKQALDNIYHKDRTVQIISNLLSDLPLKIPDLSERAFLSEALSCYRASAFRAAIVMAWNLTYDHLLRWVLSDASRLADVNASIATKFPKRSISIKRIEDFFEFKEFEVIEVLQAAGLVDRNAIRILKEKLNRRNMAAHPSNIVFIQHQADDMISDLVNNIVLKFN